MKKAADHPLQVTFLNHAWTETALAALMLMELSWAVIWYMLTTRPPAGTLAGIAVLSLIFFGSHWTVRGMQYLGWSVPIRRITFTGIVFLIWIFSTRFLLYPWENMSLLEQIRHSALSILFGKWGDRDLFHFIIINLLILRGIALASIPLERYRIIASFQLGLILVLVFGLGLGTNLTFLTALALIGYLTIGLFSHGAGNISDLAGLRGSRLPRFTAGWSLGIIIASIILAGLSVMAGWLFSLPVVMESISSAFILMASVFLMLFSILLSPILYLLVFLFQIFQEKFMQIFSKQLTHNMVESLKLGIEWPQENLKKLANFADISRSLFVGLVILLIFLGIWSILQRRIPPRHRFEEEEGNQIPLHRQPVPAGSNLNRLNRNFSPQRWLAAAHIRRIYALLMELCSKMGQTRSAAMTPLEFLPLAVRLFPGEESNLAFITTAYIQVRYAEIPENPQEITAVESAWKQIQATAKKLSRGQKRVRVL